MKPTITKEQDILIAEMYKSGMSAYKIVDELDLTRAIVYKSLTRTKTPRRHKGKAARQYHFDTTAFDNIDNEEKAYWYGFIHADACVHRTSLRLILEASDKPHIEKFNKFLKSEYEIHLRNRKSDGKIRKKARLIVTDKNFTDRLRELGITPHRKYFDLSELPQELYHHWVRGYFDANGCITRIINKGNRYTARINFSAPNKDIIIWIKDQLMQFSKIPDKKVQKIKNKEAYCIDYGGKNICEKIYNYMYKDATVFLDRKKKKFMEYY